MAQKKCRIFLKPKYKRGIIYKKQNSQDFFILLTFRKSLLTKAYKFNTGNTDYMNPGSYQNKPFASFYNQNIFTENQDKILGEKGAFTSSWLLNLSLIKRFC